MERSVSARHAATGAVDSQVLVVGAGPTGLTLAHVLAHHGVDVVVVDKGERGGPRSRPWTVALQPSSVRTLHSIDARTVRNAVVLAPPRTGTDAVATGPRRAFGTHRWAWSAAALDEVTTPLYDAAVRTLDVRARHSVQRVEHRSDHVVVHTQTDSEFAALRARFVVGCDGGTSTVAGVAAIPAHLRIRRDRLVVHADVTVRTPLPSLAEHRWKHPAGDVQALPVPPSSRWPAVARWHLSLELGAAELGHPRGERHAVADAIATRTGLSTDPAHVRLLGFVPEEVRTAERRWHDRVLLAGDAAHRDTRVGTHAVDRGITDAVSLAPKLARVVNGEAADALLHLYDVSRSPGPGSDRTVRSFVGQAGAASPIRRRRVMRTLAVGW